MTTTIESAQPEIKDMPIEDAKAFIDAGWKTMPYMMGINRDGAHSTYHALHALAAFYPRLREDFSQHALTFLEQHPQWGRVILPDLFRLAAVQSRVAAAALDAAWNNMASIKGLEGGGLAYEERKYVWSLSEQMRDLARTSGTTEHLIAKGLSVLPDSVKGTSYVVASTLFKAAEGDETTTHTIVKSVRNILPAIMEKSIHRAREMIDLIVENIGPYPYMLAEIMDEADITLKETARAHPGEDYAKVSLDGMLKLESNDPRMTRQIVTMGLDVIKAGLEKSRFTGGRLFHVLYNAGKNDPLLLPDLIETAWQTILPNYHGGMRADIITDIIEAGRHDPDARSAHKESARTAVFHIATADTWDTWRIGAPLKILRDALDITDDRRILSDAFAMIKTGRGRNERETWFIPKDGGMLVIQGKKVSALKDIGGKDFGDTEKLSQLGRIASLVFFDEMPIDEGRREIRKATGLRFETLR